MPSYYDAVAAQQAFNPFAGGYAPLAPYGYGGGGWGYDIVGQAPATTAPAPTTPQTPADAAKTDESLTEKGKKFLKKETFGVKNQNWLIGAAVIGVIYYGYQAEWFGSHKKASSGDPRRRHHRRDESSGDHSRRRGRRSHHRMY